MKTIIESVKIRNLWGIKNIETKFNSDVNIFIGSNGTSKTTFLNLIEASIVMDIQYLSSIDFESILIVLLDVLGSKQQIKIQKDFKDIPVIIYLLNDELPIEIPYSDYYRRGIIRYPNNIRETFNNLKKRLDDLVNLSWLSVHRENVLNDEMERPRDKSKNFVDERLDDLMRKLTVYQLQLESEASKVSEKFREEVFTLMLFNEIYDVFDINKVEQIDPNKIRVELFKTFRDLGVSIPNIKDTINNHIEKLTDSISQIEAVRSNEKTQLQVNDVLPLPLVSRTLSLINISKNNDEEKQRIFKPIKLYIDCLLKFIIDKEFKLDRESSGQLEVSLKEKLNKKDINLPLPTLSSGEKQLIILLTEALLQKDETYLFIADEPELSLHISWQKQIIASIRDLNKNSQIIVATHSPEIAGRWNHKIINMENITSYER